MATKESITGLYRAKFQQWPDIVATAPGRINIIGEHTDYNEGYVLPAAIDKNSIVAVSKRADKKIHLYSVLFTQAHETSVDGLKPEREHSWANYILGVVDQLIKRHYKIGGFDLVVDGDVPLGAGLSSSASVECATVVALDALFGLGISREQMTDIAQKAEHTFAGVNCGIMDQFASVFGKEGHAVRLDCRDLSYKYFPLNLGDYTLLLLDTNVKHSLATSAYNERRAACEKAVSLIEQKYANIDSLRETSLDILEEVVKDVDQNVYSKARYVVEEIHRVELASTALEKGNLEMLGELMYQTHEGLSKRYQVSCDELDYLVEETKAYPEVLGARMMGGGFGGCTINLVKHDFVDWLTTHLQIEYKSKFNLPLTPIEVIPSEGARVI